MSQPDITHHFTHTVHSRAYPALSSESIAHSAARGKTILITGGSQGIGLAIATAFAAAGAAHILLLARNPSTLNDAKEGLTGTHPVTKIHTFATDITDADAVKTVFATARADIAEPDVLVLNAGQANAPGPTLATSATALSTDFDVNVTANMTLLSEFLHKDTLTKPKPKVVLNVSTVAVNQLLPNLASYGATKLAFLYLCMHLQSEVHNDNDTDVRIMNFHPGSIFTGGAKKLGLTEDMIPWDRPDLPGAFAVWLASDEARFLAGRLVYATWDVEELKARAGEIVDGDLLRIGLRGDAVEVAE